ncbi:MAG: hypothetical protein H0W55_05465 [Actinobacteria bacterium]|nr:hypothetical protein [Actinomycetota bacterium]MDQ3531260.1 hypothetical protein [Actinomycetota bacterium]
MSPKRDLPRANDAITLYIEAIAELGRDTNLTGLGQSRELDFRRGSPRRNVFPSTAPRFVHREELFLLKHGVVVESDASNNLCSRLIMFQPFVVNESSRERVREP